jgi:hypothetical protein
MENKKGLKDRTVLEAFKLGKKAEDNLLPIFKPFEFPAKDLLEAVMKLQFPEEFTTNKDVVPKIDETALSIKRKVSSKKLLPLIP